MLHRVWVFEGHTTQKAFFPEFIWLPIKYFSLPSYECFKISHIFCVVMLTNQNKVEPFQVTGEVISITRIASALAIISFCLLILCQ